MAGLAQLLLIGGCSDRAPVATTGGSASAPHDAATSAPAPVADGPDLTIETRTTAAGGAVVAVGKPRLRVTSEFGGPLVVRASAKRVFAYDDGEIKIWELDRGTLIKRIDLGVPFQQARSPRVRSPLVVSDDGQTLATSVDLETQFRREPFDAVAGRRALMQPISFTKDGGEIIAAGMDTAALATTPPFGLVAAPPMADSFRFPRGALQIESTVYEVWEHGLRHWNRATNTRSVVTQTLLPWGVAMVALRAPVALVMEKGTERMYVLDLLTGATEPLPRTARVRSAIAPSGKRLALVGEQIEIVDRPGTTVATIHPRAGTSEVTFAETDELLGYDDGGQIVVYDLPKGPRSYGTPSRFVRFVGEDLAEIERGGKHTLVTISTRAEAPLDAGSALAAANAPANAPNWATSVTTASDGTVVATAPLPVPTLALARRQGDCPPSFDIWTAEGKARTLTFQPTRSDDWTAIDPCWLVAGRRVFGASAERITVFDAVSGQRTAVIPVGEPPKQVDDDTFRHQFWMIAAAPDGKQLAVWWRRADMWPPPAPPDPSPYGHGPEPAPLECEADEREANCLKEYFLELWSLEGPKPVRRWRYRPDSGEWGSRRWSYSMEPSGPLAFTRDGAHVIAGYRAGEIRIHSTRTAEPVRIEQLHHDPITRIEISPGDRYVFSEDEGGEQRIWPLALRP